MKPGAVMNARAPVPATPMPPLHAVAPRDDVSDPWWFPLMWALFAVTVLGLQCWLGPVEMLR